MLTPYKNIVGDIYSYKFANDFYFFFRILFSPRLLFYEKNLIDKTSPLYFFKDCDLIEIYDYHAETNNFEPVNLKKTISDPIFCSFKSLVGGGIVEHVGFKEVQISEIVFPEFVASRDSFLAVFEKGEVRIDFEYDIDWVTELNVLPKTFPGNDLGEFYLLNSKLFEKFNYKEEDLDWCNANLFTLKRNEGKKKIYDLINFDEKESYKDFSEKHNLNFMRFFN